VLDFATFFGIANKNVIFYMFGYVGPRQEAPPALTFQ
jgi:hypothetical protein